jgi:hypothetical protein
MGDWFKCNSNKYLVCNNKNQFIIHRMLIVEEFKIHKVMLVGYYLLNSLKMRSTIKQMNSPQVKEQA